MRFVLIFLVVLCAALGALFGALNPDRITLDFYFAAIEIPKGAALLLALLIGWAAGGLLVYFSLALPLRRRVRLQRRELKRIHAASEAASSESEESSSGALIHVRQA